ncbi:MAG: DUF4136 domain-containing protein [Kordiimonadaceae bacterium]|jgi:hypothetical protein|nr:DUF4136 domain-containing protein [Kordiimonadaceae bacterium]MBT6033159.1 DUF4136 domain-containing protein [Kordiimonadaceae bacterium]
MEKIYKILITVIVTALLASCTQSIRSNVTRFHALPAPNGEKIVIVPMNAANNGSLEFANYAALVGNALGSYGYLPANGEEADLVVELDYDVIQGPTKIRSSASSRGFVSYGSYYGRYMNPWFPYRGLHSGYYGFYGSPYAFGNIYDPFGYYPLGWSNNNVRSIPNYTRQLKMVIRPNKDNGQNLFEGEVSSTGRSAKLHEVMPYLVQAFFTNFPGVSGSSERVSIELPQS